MATTLPGIPGVFFQERRAQPARVLPTGVPVFVGLLAPDAPMPAGSPPSATLYGPVALHHKTDFLGGAAAFLRHAINGFFDNGGGYCYVVGIKAEPKAGAEAAALMIGALSLTVALDDVDLVAMPDAHVLLKEGAVDESLICQVQRATIAHCTKMRTRFALLDAMRDKSAQEIIDDQVRQLGIPAIGAVNAALYHPWIGTVGSGSTVVPPCGQIAGIISRTDAEVGVFKAPANTEVRDATDLEADFDTDSLAQLLAGGVNCIRAFPGRGIRVWGARTLSTDPDWTYLNVRRLVLTILRWIEMNMTWAAFEPNTPALWARIERELGTYLTELWRVGALQGDDTSQAFFVRCDADLNAADTRDAGQVITEIGLAPSAPAEFIVVTVQHRAGTTELT